MHEEEKVGFKIWLWRYTVDKTIDTAMASLQTLDSSEAISWWLIPTENISIM